MSLYVFIHLSFNGDGVLICSIDNMPTQIPTEATHYFGNLLLPYVPDFVSDDHWINYMQIHFSQKGIFVYVNWKIELCNWYLYANIALISLQLFSDAWKPFDDYNCSPVVKDVSTFYIIYYGMFCE